MSSTVGYYLTVNGDAGDDNIRIPFSNVGAGAYILGGAGNDTVDVYDLQFFFLYFSSGTGDDKLNLGEVQAALWTYLDGGAGTDTYIPYGVNTLGTLYKYNFEN